jgi:hypothetical protein
MLLPRWTCTIGRRAAADPFGTAEASFARACSAVTLATTAGTDAVWSEARVTPRYAEDLARRTTMSVPATGEVPVGLRGAHVLPAVPVDQ